MKRQLLALLALAALFILPISQATAQAAFTKGQRVRAVADYEKITTGDLGWFYTEVADGEPSMLVVWDKDVDATPNIDYLEEAFPRILSGRVYFVNKDSITAVSGVKKTDFNRLAADWFASATPETLFPIGSRVILGKHDQADSSDKDSTNWTEEMDAFVGKEATITGHSGTDSYDKAGVEVDVDGDSEHGHYFWRIENLTLIERGSGESATEEGDGEDDSATSGDDQGSYSDEGDGDYSDDQSGDGDYSDDQSGDDGSSDDQSSYSEDDSSSQQYDAEDTAFFENFPVGTKVIVGRHSKIDAEDDGSDNWTEEMDAFVGKEATITSHEGLCPWGEASVKVDIDDGQYYWRIRDMKKVE